MGLTTSEAVRLLFHRIVADQAFPPELKVPNQVTRDAIAEADAIAAGKSARF
jgi:DNA-damage-inducible protein J